MNTSNIPPRTDAPELQAVLTRYIDSCDGYLKASEQIDNPSVKATFRGIASRRRQVSSVIAGEIAAQGQSPDVDGSIEAKLHRWWIDLRSGSDHDLEAVASECLRGERDLQNTLEDALSDGNLLTDHQALVQQALAEIKTTVAELESAVGS